MELHYTAVIFATILQFMFGALWYMVIFGKLWGRMHGFEKFSKEEQQKMAKKMGPFYALQIFVTLITTVVFALLLSDFSSQWSLYSLAFFFWLGFIVPTQVSAVVFGGTEPRWVVKKIAIMAGGALGCLLIVAAVFDMMMK